MITEIKNMTVFNNGLHKDLEYHVYDYKANLIFEYCYEDDNLNYNGIIYNNEIIYLKTNA